MNLSRNLYKVRGGGELGIENVTHFDIARIQEVTHCSRCSFQLDRSDQVEDQVESKIEPMVCVTHDKI